MRLTEGHVKSRIYLIIRVFNLGQAKAIDYRIYLDPWSVKERGELRFTANNWKVEPTWSRNEQETQSDSPASNTFEASTPQSTPSATFQRLASGFFTRSNNDNWSNSGFGSHNAATDISNKVTRLFPQITLAPKSYFPMWQAPPTTVTKPFVVTSLLDVHSDIPSHYQSITHMLEYQKWSFEESCMQVLFCVYANGM